MLKHAALLATLVTLHGCAGVPEETVTREERTFARKFLGLMQDEHFDSVYSLLAPETKTERARGVLPLVAGVFKDAWLDSARLSYYNRTSGDTASLELRFEVPTADPQRWVLAGVHTRTENGQVVVAGFSASPIPGPSAVARGSWFDARSLISYLLLAVAVVAWYAVRSRRKRTEPVDPPPPSE